MARLRSVALGHVHGVERPPIARPPTVTVVASPAGIISCHAWAELAHPARRGTGEFVRVLCGELAEPFGDRVDGRLAGGDVDHEVVDVVVAGA